MAPPSWSASSGSLGAFPVAQALMSFDVAPQQPARGKYRRRRERRPLVGMLVHLDASTHEWLAGLPMQDLIVALADADGRLLLRPGYLRLIR